MQFDNATNLDRKSGVRGNITVCFHCFSSRAQHLSPSRSKKRLLGLLADFLWGLVGSRNFMRLSLQKAAHANMGGAAYRKSGSPRLFRPTYPDFLSRLVALSNCMRLSLKKAAHAVLSDAA
jgi:hypothetical protein